ncbi:pyridoxal phosphate-dependent aminotransferase [Alkalimonas delamerensis]|uniref:Pyridoxal phosphate-dependent aminotransferase n=1 Tax=Alkalimonas delamerensis TaxID=265981 RepID=A0ABT9GTI9_9GAMM|nr:pyridoxal phosphate-dependent aminotransferase [Alkalimonas delamerensis]MDP4530284.1 pyridoxal phosphate-dependent aminotransferase [Alkalimonas delamerensis]
MQNDLQSKLPGIGTSIFTTMSQLAAEQQAINLSQGFPDFGCDPFLVEQLASFSQQGLNQYAPMAGVLPLRQQIAALIARCYHQKVCPEQHITVTSGATEALFCAIQALVRPGDEVIVFDPAYDSYAPAVQLAGGATVHLALLAPDFQVDWQQVADAINDKTRLIIVNSPHNPSSKVFSASDWQQLQQLVCQHGLYCISDEVYEHMVFDGRPQLSALCFPDLAARSLVVSSFGKTFHVTGWKLGYCVAPPALMVEFRKVHQYVTFSSFTPAQFAVAAMLEQQPEQVVGLAAFYQRKRDVFCAALSGSRLQLLPAEGTYFQLADYSAISELPDLEFCRWLTVQHKVAAIPLSVFYRQPPAQRLVRFCFAKEESTLQQAAEVLCRL